jgi:hypothetical protein
MTLQLRAPFDIAPLNVGLTLQREVNARITPLSGSGGAFAVAWQPMAAGPFPAFSGTLFITRSDSEKAESILTLDGHYHPPLGLAGDVFDAFVGRHIAQATSSDLLERISAFIGGGATFAKREPGDVAAPVGNA